MFLHPSNPKGMNLSEDKLVLLNLIPVVITRNFLACYGENCQAITMLKPLKALQSTGPPV